MYPLKFKPILKSTLWGGERIIPFKQLDCQQEQVGESWEISDVPGDESVVAEGADAGKNLTQLMEEYKGKLVGEENYKRFQGKFPLLIKFIDAKQDLSIQVHPDDELAMKRHQSMGKTEMWYILDCEPDSFLYFGVNKEITKEEFERRIQDNTLLDVLKAVPVHKGDVFFIKSGTIHAIGAGIQICEIQQNSNTTYRVYDFGRVGKDGKPRELHIQKAIDVSNLSPIESDFKPCGPEEKNGDCDTVRLATCEYFTTYESTLNGTTTLHVDDESFGSILLIEGNATIENDGTTLEVNKGDSVFIDANSGDVKITGKCQWIYSRV